jgi:uncharacterized protein (DUF111 family)
LKVAYFDCQFGAAGDMLIGAMLDAGLDKHKWLAEIAKIALPDDSYRIQIKKVQRRTLAATKFDVIVNENVSAPALRQSQDHGHDHHHHHDNEFVHHHDHGGIAVAMADVQGVIRSSPISNIAKELALQVVERLGGCEGPVHGMAPDAVYFHEVGAVDSIIDIIGFAIGYEMLGIEKSYVSAVPIGRGHVLTAGGHFPVPAPAVALMLAQIRAPILDYEIDFECLTPTAVAILAEICPKWGVMPKFDEVHSVGYGAGTRESLSHANICRVMLGELADPASV